MSGKWKVGSPFKLGLKTGLHCDEGGFVRTKGWKRKGREVGVGFVATKGGSSRRTLR